MNEEKFLECLREQAEEEIGRIRHQAEEEKRRIDEEARQEAGREADERLRAARAGASALRARILNAARLAGRRDLLEAAHRFAGEVFEALGRLAAGVSGEERVRVLEGLLDECLVAGESEILCRPEDREPLEGLVRRRGLAASLRDEDLPLGGIVVVSDGGLFVQDNTFEARLLKAKPELMRRIAAAFPFEDGG